MGLLLLYLIIAISISFLCSVMEAVLLSSTISFINTKEAEGSRAAKIFKNLKSDVDKPISAILTLNTIAHTIGAAGVGAQATAVFGEAYFGIISIILTILILVFSEIIPKTLGANFWRELYSPSAYVIKWMIYITYPFVIISDFITRIMPERKSGQTISREEISAITNIGAKEGVIDESESKIIDNLIKIRFIKVRSIMTPRTVLVAAPEDQTLGEFFQIKEYFQYSRIPIYNGTIDAISGYILKTDVLEKLANNQPNLTLKEIRRPITVCHESFNIQKLFEKLISQKEHIALVIDEYGGVEGIATMEDIIETILGLEIVDEKDGNTDMQQLAKELWQKRIKNLDSNNEEK